MLLEDMPRRLLLLFWARERGVVVRCRREMREEDMEEVGERVAAREMVGVEKAFGGWEVRRRLLAVRPAIPMITVMLQIIHQSVIDRRWYISCNM